MKWKNDFVKEIFSIFVTIDLASSLSAFCQHFYHTELKVFI